MKIKIKTADLIGPALDYAVAKCAGLGKLNYSDTVGRVSTLRNAVMVWSMELPGVGSGDKFSPSTDWSQGGPIIASGKINIKSNLARMPDRPEYDWLADCPEKGLCVSFNGPTPLIAAMRCYVAATLGDEVEIPGEFI